MQWVVVGFHHVEQATRSSIFNIFSNFTCFFDSAIAG